MKRLLAVGVVLAILLGTVPVTGAQDVDRDPARSINTAQDFDRVQFRITVHENGSARWTFHYERTLDNESQRQQFEQFAKQFNEEDSKLYGNFQRQAGSLVDMGENATGRSMVAKNFSKHAEVAGLDNNVGTVEMSFTWSNFTAADGERRVLGDVFEGGLYLAPNQSLVIQTGPGLEFDEVEPKPDVIADSSLEKSDSITWMNEHEFADNRPRITFVSTSSQELGDVGESAGGDSPESVLFAGAIVMLIGLGAVIAWRRGGFGLPSFRDGSSGTAGGTETAATSTNGSGASVQPAVSDEELLTDEARVKKLLRESGGRMKQVNIVENTGWSKSKVSMLLSDMAEEGEISKLRVGRENIISLDGHEPDATRSPHDEPR